MFYLFCFWATLVSWWMLGSLATDKRCDENCVDYHRFCPSIKNQTFYNDYLAKHRIPPPPDCDGVFYRFACPRSCEICISCESILLEEARLDNNDMTANVENGSLSDGGVNELLISQQENNVIGSEEENSLPETASVVGSEEENSLSETSDLAGPTSSPQENNVVESEEENSLSETSDLAFPTSSPQENNVVEKEEDSLSETSDLATSTSSPQEKNSIESEEENSLSETSDLAGPTSSPQENNVVESEKENSLSETSDLAFPTSSPQENNVVEKEEGNSLSETSDLATSTSSPQENNSVESEEESEKLELIYDEEDKGWNGEFPLERSLDEDNATFYMSDMMGNPSVEYSFGKRHSVEKVNYIPRTGSQYMEIASDVEISTCEDNGQCTRCPTSNNHGARLEILCDNQQGNSIKIEEPDLNSLLTIAEIEVWGTEVGRDNSGFSKTKKLASVQIR